MRAVRLTRGYAALVDNDDYERVIAAGPWFAKRCAHTVYAIRNARRADGRRHMQYGRHLPAPTQGGKP